MNRSNRKSPFHKKRFYGRPENAEKRMEVLDKFVSGKATLVKTITELGEMYCPAKLNLIYKKDILEKLKKGEYTKEQADGKLRFFYHLPHEFTPRPNGNKRSNRKSRNNNTTNRKPNANNRTNNKKNNNVKANNAN